MIKYKGHAEVKIGDRNYQFLCESDSPTSEVINVLTIWLDQAKKIKSDQELAQKAKEDAEVAK